MPDLEPAKKRARLECGRDRQADDGVPYDSEDARSAVRKVFSLYQDVHFPDTKRSGKPVTSECFLAFVANPLDGHAAGKFALGACLQGLLGKFSIDSLTLLNFVQQVLAAAHDHQAPLEALQYLVKALPKHLATLSAHTAPPHVSPPTPPIPKDAFKALCLAVLGMCTAQYSELEGELFEAAVSMFKQQPHWFVLALTDALEQGAHSARPGATAFGDRVLCGTPADMSQPLFKTVTCRDATLAKDVDLLLNSCINEVSGKRNLGASLALMKRLRNLLRPSGDAATDPGPRPALPAHPNDYSDAPYAPAASALDRRPPAESPAPAQAVPGSINDAYAHHAMGMDDARGSTPARASSLRRVRVYAVGPALKLTGMRPHLSQSEAAGELQRLPGFTSVDLQTSTDAVAHFVCTEAAAAALQAMGRTRAPLRGLGNFRATFAAPASGQEPMWLWVEAYNDVGVLRVLHAREVPAPWGSVALPDACCGAGVLLRYTSAADLSLAQQALEAWPEAVARKEQLLHQHQQQQQQQQRHAQDTSQSASSRSPSLAESPADGDAADAPGGAAAWTGTISKSSVPQCTVHVTDASDVAAREVLLWPSTLDMQHRIDIHQVVHVTYAGHPEAKRGWAWVRPVEDSRTGFQSFLAYLTSRARAGVARPQLLEPSVAARASATSPQTHVVYFVPATPEICSFLHTEMDDEGLLVLVLVASAAP